MSENEISNNMSTSYNAEIQSRPIVVVGRFRNFRFSVPYDMFMNRRDAIIQFATDRSKFFYCQEELSDNGFHHFECFLNSKNSMTVKSLNRILDINHSWGVRPEDLEREVDYVRKTDSRVENGEVISLGQAPAKMPFFKDFYNQLLNFDTFEDAMVYLRDRDPQTYVLKRPAMEACLQREHRKRVVANFTQFNIPFFDVNDGKSHIFVGDTGISKTNFALAHFDNPILVSERQDFANINSLTDGIVIDDCIFKLWLATNVPHIFDVALDRSVNIKYGTAVIPSNPQWIITLNDLALFWPTDLLSKTKEAIFRRIVIHEFGNTPLYGEQVPLKVFKEDELITVAEDSRVNTEPVPVSSSYNIPYPISDTTLEIQNFYLDSYTDDLRQFPVDLDKSVEEENPPQLNKYDDISNYLLDSLVSMPELEKMSGPVYDFNRIFVNTVTPKNISSCRLVEYSNSSSHFSLPGDFFIGIDA